jgi:D-3-phosphoglycerate dehydrogenase
LDNNPNFKFEIIEDTSTENLIKKLPAFDACTLRVSKLDENILSHCSNLKAISRHGVGYDNVDLNYIKKKNISLLITATANAVAVAEHVISMFLTLSKSTKIYDQEVRDGKFKSNANKIQTFEMFNKNILIAGFGRIGKKLISRCISFDTNVYVYDPYVDENTINKYGGKKVNSINDALKIADYISLHMPLTNETKNLIDYSVLKEMKSNSIIVNTARGGIINEIDLNKALNEGLIFGAGLDVFSKEPIENNNPLLKNKKIILSPHSATFTDECTSRMGIETTKNIIDFFNNKLDKSMVVKL